jgi:hypothetical protein
MSLLLQELLSAKVEASGSRIHADERVSDRRLDLENPWPIAGDYCSSMTEICGCREKTFGIYIGAKRTGPMLFN